MREYHHDDNKPALPDLSGEINPKVDVGPARFRRGLQVGTDDSTSLFNEVPTPYLHVQSQMDAGRTEPFRPD